MTRKGMYKLKIEPFRVWFHLGCEASERVHAQPVDISLIIKFHALPKACITDELKDTVDYSQFIEVARQLGKNMEFKVIEHLAYKLHEEFKKLIIIDSKLIIKVHKLFPPIEGLTNGVTFILC